ncbi:MAG: hypothetical protein H7Y38_02135 [Armatimonadetes bacterium]|nr:hypothetical protein [Armatimonadota bacterium]
MQTLVAGIDAGGTSVRVMLADAETGVPIGETVTVAATSSGEPPPFAPSFSAVSVCAGIAKYTRPGVVAAWETSLAVRFPGAIIKVVPDYETAFHAAVPEGSGVCVVAGTGSVAYGENAATGNTVRVGGRGWEWGDEGSGAWLSTEMVRRTLRALDGQAPATALTRRVCAELRTNDAATLAQTAREMASEGGRGFLLPLLVRLHDSGDAEARGLLVGAGGWLASLGTAVARQLGFAPENPVTFAGAGGVWKAGGVAVQEAFALAVRRSFPGACFSFSHHEPVTGAVRLARKH